MKKLLATLALAVCAAFTASAKTVNLSKLTKDIVLQDGDYVKGNLTNKVDFLAERIKVSIADGATVTLGKLKIANQTGYPGITCEGNATIVLDGESEIRAGGFAEVSGTGHPGIYVSSGHWLEIKGSGSLDVYGADEAAGIGGGKNMSCGSIIISGGNIRAMGGSYLGKDSTSNNILLGPGIGSCGDSACDGIMFKGGFVETWGHPSAVGWSGSSQPDSHIFFLEGIGKVTMVGTANPYFAGSAGQTAFINPPLSQKLRENYAPSMPSFEFINLTLAEKWNTLTVSSPLGGLTGNKTFKDGDVITGELAGDYKISIAKNATVTLRNAKIGPTLKTDMPGITCNGSATIILEGENHVEGCGHYFPGIFVPREGFLYIRGSGSLVAKSGGDNAVGIGGCHPGLRPVIIGVDELSNYQQPGGEVVIFSGEVTAIGGAHAPGIGPYYGQDANGEYYQYGNRAFFYTGYVRVVGGMTPDVEYVDEYVYYRSFTNPDGMHEFECYWDGNLEVLNLGYYANKQDIYAVARDGVVLRGSFKRKKGVNDRGQISIAPGATVEMQDVHIKIVDCEGDAIKLNGDAKLYVYGTNSLSTASDVRGGRGIYVPYGSELEITGGGVLKATGSHYGVGIGGGQESSGSIVVMNADITAKALSHGRGLSLATTDSTTGVPLEKACGPVRINGGCVKSYAGKEVNPLAPDDNLVTIGKHLVRTVDKDDNGYYTLVSWDGNLGGVGGGDGEEQGSPSPKKLMKLASASSAAPLGADSGDGDLDLDKDVESEAIAGHGVVITGTLSGSHKIAIADDATVILRDATIPGGFSADTPYAGLTCLGNATIVLEGDNVIRSHSGYFPGIYVRSGCRLVIKGTGRLEASCTGEGSYAAGIGGGGHSDNIASRPGGDIIIEGGDITALGGMNAAGIGGGCASSCGRITINGGKVYAEALNGGAGIGAGYDGSCEGITLGSGVEMVTAQCYGSPAAPVGAGAGTSSCGFVNIDSCLVNDSTVASRQIWRWNGKLAGAATVTVADGGSITGSNNGGVRNIKIGPGANVTLKNATISSSLGYSDFTGDTAPWAAITCLGDATITLSGENSVSSFNKNHPCIYVPRGSTLTIKGGETDSLTTLNTASGARGAGIGGGEYLDCGKIVIDGGCITAASTGHAAAIGGGYGANCDGVEIGAGVKSLDAQVPYRAAEQTMADAEPLGRGEKGARAYSYVAHGLNKIDTGTWTHARYEQNPNVDLSTVAADKVITDGAVVTGTLRGHARKITIASGATITLKDVVIEGKTAGLQCAGNATIYLEGSNYVYGSDNWPGIHVPAGSTLRIDSEGNGSLEAYGGSDSAGIGTGSIHTGGTANVNDTCGTILIDGGFVNATGRGYGAGIGAAQNLSYCGEIVINGGNVVANGYNGLGNGYQGQCEGVYIGEGIDSVSAYKGIVLPSGISPDISSKLRDETIDGTRFITPNPDISLASLSSGSEPVVVKNTATISGNLSAKRKIVIAAGAEVTLDGVTINGTDDSNYSWAGITCEGDAQIVLKGANTVRGFYRNWPGIYVPKGSTLTIKGDGSLDASSNGYGSGIGGGQSLSCGNIVVLGGRITATGGYANSTAETGIGAGIGGGAYAGCGFVLVDGGVVHAKGNGGCAAIGGGYGASWGSVAIGDSVTYVIAELGPNSNTDPLGAGAEGAETGSVSISSSLASSREGSADAPRQTIMVKNFDLSVLKDDITLANGVTVKGTLGERRKLSIAAGATVTLDTARVSFSSSSSAPWAGLTCLGDATLVLKGSSNIRGFYQGYPGIYVPKGSRLSIEGAGALYAYCSDGSFPNAAGIGGCGSGSGADCGRIVIDSGTVTATGHSAAGIGSGTFDAIEINGGVVTATATAGGAGIGAGLSNGVCGDIVINGGTVTATSESDGASGAGIGGGRYGRGVNVTIGPGVKSVIATANSGGSPIGAGYIPSGSAPVVTVAENLIDTTSGNTRSIAQPRELDLSTYTGSGMILLRNGDRVSGTLAGSYRVRIAAGATVWLNNVRINGSSATTPSHQGIFCEGDATIVLEGSNYVKGYYRNAGITVADGYTLTIKGDGELEAIGIESAGIGGSKYAGSDERTCGNIVIEGGVITARGGSGAAGIGGTRYKASSDDKLGANCRNVTILGGDVTAIAGAGAAAIGGGYGTHCGDVTVGPGVSKLALRWNSDDAQSIGTGKSIVTTFGTFTSKCGTVTIDPSLEYTDAAVSSSDTLRTYRPLWNGDLDTLNENVTAKNGTVIYGANDGNYVITVENGATIELDNVNLVGQISCSGNATIVLTGANTISEVYGSLKDGISVVGTLTIKGDGSLDIAGADGYDGGAGICGGNIVIESGTVIATGGGYARGSAAIGGHFNSSCGNITIGPGVTKVVAKVRSNGDANPIGLGYCSSSSYTCGTITVYPSLSNETGEWIDNSGYSPVTYNTRTITRSADADAAAAFEAWKAEQNAQGANLSGAWGATDANGVANVFRYVFNEPGEDFDGNVVLGFETDGEGRVAIQTPPVVNGKNIFSFKVVASDSADGSGNKMEYPLAVDDPEGITVIEEEYNPDRFFRVIIELK